MLGTPLDIIGTARVHLTYDGAGELTAEYVFSNGFDTGRPTGALPGAAPIDVGALGQDLTVFLSEPVDTGTTTGQGGVVATAHFAGETATPIPAYCRVEYAPALAGDYADVAPAKAIKLFFSAGDEYAPLDAETDVTIVVLRAPQTLHDHE